MLLCEHIRLNSKIRLCSCRAHKGWGSAIRCSLFDVSGFANWVSTPCFVIWMSTTRFLNNSSIAGSFRDGGGGKKVPYGTIPSDPGSQREKIKVHNDFYSYSRYFGFTFCGMLSKFPPCYKKNQPATLILWGYPCWPPARLILQLCVWCERGCERRDLQSLSSNTFTLLTSPLNWYLKPQFDLHFIDWS